MAGIQADMVWILQLYLNHKHSIIIAEMYKKMYDLKGTESLHMILCLFMY